MEENEYPAERTIQQLMDDFGITATITEGGPQSSEMPDHRSWTVTFKRIPLGAPLERERTFTAMFYSNTEPTGDQVLACVLDEGREALEYDFEEWANNFGYDTDSRKAEGLYKACRKNGQDLQAFLGGYHQAFLEAD